MFDRPLATHLQIFSLHMSYGLVVIVYSYQCWCPRGKSLSSRISTTNLQVGVLVLGSQVLVLVLVPQSPRKLSMTLHSANSPLCMKSINSVTATMYYHVLLLPCMRSGKMAYLLMSDITYWYMQVSKSFFTVTQCCCPWGKSLSFLRRLIYKSLSLSSDIKSLYLSLY